jgi:tetratricopeptide (TPR) repeat protein
MRAITRLTLALAFCLGIATARSAPHSAVKEYEKVFTTYDYSDPDPVPTMSRFYPYFRYDGFTDVPIQKKWKVVELSNDYLRLLILPEIGGKVWAAIDKTTGRSFIYYNHVVKFRDISMRGPWTSGGMEANYGIIGHTPNCFSPVDYVARRNPDGSASCIIGTLDLLTRTTWRLEINLPAREAGFYTRSLWHNGSGASQPYYTWMNVGIKSAGNLQFINPGTRYLGHDGRAFNWPLHPENGHDLSWYEQNNFGPYKSYHVFGRLSEFFGAYYHDDDYGMAHIAAYGDKPGRKVWIWGLSRQGMIWEKLLTDSDGQYVEVQSGRLFNQTADDSSVTPFKHKEFPPYATDTWSEYWEPVKGIKGFVNASSFGALNVSREGKNVVIRISPTRASKDKLEVFDGETRLWSQEIEVKPMQPVERVVPLTAEPKALRVTFGGNKLQYEATQRDVLRRPVESPANFDWHSAFGHYLQGRENVDERAYFSAETNFEACLEVDPNYAPALVELAALANRQADWTSARDLSRHALSIDAYDPGANYQFGIANAAIGNVADAKDAFSIAALSIGWRSAASIELAKLYLREKQYDRALACAETALDYDRRNLDGLQLQACIARSRGDRAAASKCCHALLELDPLSHFALFEKYLIGTGTKEEFTSQLRNELPHETCLELAAWYHSVGQDQDAARVLELSPPNGEVLYWLAWLRRDTNLLARAEAALPAFVFPFRTESIPVFDWAGQGSRAWQPRYYLALIRWYQGKLAQAHQLLVACGDEPRFAPFYAARAQVADETAPRDLGRAADLDPAQWRYGAMLVKHYLGHTNAAAALPEAAKYYRRFSTNNVLALLYAKTLVLNGQHQAALDLLSGLNVLPCEGSTEARATRREACLMLAVSQMRTNSFAQALALINQAREWPENLGAGQPYASDLDERLEDWLAYQCAQRIKDSDAARRALEKILAFGANAKPSGAGSLVRVLALKESGRIPDADKLLKQWQAIPAEAPMATWAAEVLSGTHADLPVTVQDSGCRVLAAWLRMPKPQ